MFAGWRLLLYLLWPICVNQLRFRFSLRCFFWNQLPCISTLPIGLRSTIVVFLRSLLVGFSFWSCWHQFPLCYLYSEFLCRFLLRRCSSGRVVVRRLSMFLLLHLAPRFSGTCMSSLFTTYSHKCRCHYRTLAYRHQVPALSYTKI